MRYSSSYLVLLLLASLFIGCVAEKEAHKAVSLEEIFYLMPSDTVQLKDNDNRFLLSLQQLEDSRCPENANCITAGKARVALVVEHLPQKVLLCIGEDCSAEEENFYLFEYNSKRYTVVLEEILPYPKESSDPEKKRAILKIKRTTG